MSDILERAKLAQARAAEACPVTIRLDLLEELIAEIERLQAEVGRLAHPATTAIGSVREIVDKQLKP